MVSIFLPTTRKKIFCLVFFLPSFLSFSFLSSFLPSFPLLLSFFFFLSCLPSLPSLPYLAFSISMIFTLNIIDTKYGTVYTKRHNTAMKTPSSMLICDLSRQVNSKRTRQFPTLKRPMKKRMSKRTGCSIVFLKDQTFSFFFLLL